MTTKSGITDTLMQAYKKIVDDALKSLPNDRLLQEFCSLYLKSMSPRVLVEYNSTTLANFLVERYEFFTVSYKTNSYFSIYTPPKRTGHLSDKRILEYVCPDATFLLITVEALFRQYNLRITRMLHPIVTVVSTKTGRIQSFTPPQQGENTYSLTYIEFEDIEDEEVISELRDKLTYHISAVQYANIHQPELVKLADTIKAELPAAIKKPAEPVEEWQNLIDWLKDENFSIFGYIKLTHSADNTTPKLHKKDGLGILAPAHCKLDKSSLLNTLKAHCYRQKDHPEAFVFDTIKILSPIQRFDNLMRLSLKVKGPKKTVIEHNFIGLLRRSSLHAKNIQTPLIHLKMKTIIQNKHMLSKSYDYNELIRIFTATPKFELFRTKTDTLQLMVEDLLSITNPNEIFVFTRPRDVNERIALMVVIPYSLFSKFNIKTVSDYLEGIIPHTDMEVIRIYHEEKCRLHFYFEQAVRNDWTPDQEKIERNIRQLIKPWEDQLRDLINQKYPGILGKNLYNHYVHAFPRHYRVRNTADDTLRDIMYLEKLAHQNQVQFNLVPFISTHSTLSGEASMLSIYSRGKIDLIDIMPILQNLDLHVLDELTTRIGSFDNIIGYIYSFRVLDNSGKKLEEDRYRTLVVDLLNEVFKEQTENDQLNGLSLRAQLNWREINILQTYRNLYLQLGVPYSKEKINQTLLKHPDSAKLMIHYFFMKFSPENQYGDITYREEVLLPPKKREFVDSLIAVSEVSDDLILRRLFNLIEHTFRTNFFIPKPPESTTISIKLNSQNVRQMPLPAPYCEIYVHDVGMEGVHLRFGPIARGGLRWSDRPDDFRKEILDLVKTQQTKNVVIVPVGAKGGFIIKKNNLSPNEKALESVKQYEKFIRALLDITDNITGNQEKHPNFVLCYDKFDPYLVVAADKGTATFSDIANKISAETKFWLGNAFASGGSVGYNHKEVGITAKGAWECVKLHFLEMGIDIQTDPVTVAGIGDMSGDVFGNGMLLSKAIQLQAAFNHAHIFIDPSPDATKSWKERKRLFELPRSTWEDYNASLISQGGGIYSRKAKEIHLSSEAKRLLGTKKDTHTGEEVIRLILKMKVGLLWFGGIGTYIKATTQTNIEVGDPTNDPVRIDASECQASVIGEGANLGLTQAGRIEYAMNGGKVNTDAIDNSAGVNMSDYEVNIKIALDLILKSNQISNIDDSNRLLKELTDTVTELVLENNQSQHRLLSMDQIRSQHQFNLFVRHIQKLVADQVIDPITESLPTTQTIETLALKNAAMPRPVLAVIQAYVKMRIFNHLLNTDLVMNADLNTYFAHYFPKQLWQKYGSEIDKHRLKKHIIATQVTNSIINWSGVTFFHKIEQLTGKNIETIAKAYIVINQSVDAFTLRETILNEPAKQTDKYNALIEMESMIHLLTTNLLKLSNFDLQLQLSDDLAKITKTLRPIIQKDNKNWVEITTHWRKLGFSENTTQTLGALLCSGAAVEVFYLNKKEKLNPKTALKLIRKIESIFHFNWLADMINVLKPTSSWQLSHKEILLQSIRNQKLKFIHFVLASFKPKDLEKIEKQSILNVIAEKFQLEINAYFATLEKLKASSPTNLTQLAVTVDHLNFIDVANLD